MMGEETPPQRPLFHAGIDLDQRIRSDHPLREIAAAVDFTFISREVRHLYGTEGNESVPPPVILKMMFLLFFYDVPSEREMMKTIPERLDWMWFLGFELESKVPNHSVLSKARTRWGSDAFRRFFERILAQCVDAGLVDGRKIFCDSTLIDADASVDSVSKWGKIASFSKELERRLESGDADNETEDSSEKDGSVLKSTTDPDAAVVPSRRTKARPRYKSHRAIDTGHGVITATELTPGDINEGHKLLDLIDQHEELTDVRVEVAVGDSQYGTRDNFLACNDRGITAHLSPLREVNNDAALKRKGKLRREDFVYDPTTDSYLCPTGHSLRRLQNKPDKSAVQYAASREDCQNCPIRSRCTDSKTRGRSILRDYREDELDALIALTHLPAARADLRRRHHFMEGSFAHGIRHGLKRSRWRRQWRAEIQDLMIAAIQNIAILVRAKRRKNAAAMAMAVDKAFSSMLLITRFRRPNHLPA